jgi:putative DNA-invertase from lambdoid prophage Rac
LNIPAGNATIARAICCTGDKIGGGHGRKPSYTRQQYERARALLSQEVVAMARIAKETGLTRQTIYRIKDDPASAEAALAAWGL